MKIPSIAEIDIRDKKVLIRVDFDMPAKGGEGGEWKLQRALPTIKYALGQKARVVLASHLGSPGGKVNRRYSLERIGRRLSELLDCEIYFPEDSVGDAVKKIAADMTGGSVMLLENLDFHKGELSESADYGRKLAEIADVYVNEAFRVSHQARASITAAPGFFDAVCVGLWFKSEAENLGRFANPERPFTVIIGGAGSASKLALIESLMDRADTYLIGGAIAQVFLKALGRDTGLSEIDQGLLYNAKKIISGASSRNIRFVLPDDLAAERGNLKKGSPSFIISRDSIPRDSRIVDIGPETRHRFASYISGSRMILWNGPLGICEEPDYSAGTAEVLRAVCESGVWTGIIGDDTAGAVHELGHEGLTGFISRGGEAAVEFVAAGTLPAITALEEKTR